MGTTNEDIGTCPECGGAIPAYEVLISYDTAAGEQHYAECPTCESVVHPLRDES